uniref:Uncharacterized protein n=1 Tax=Arundo donax TaxID=35708 RepID=A0A0A8XP50_ARUDO
MQELSTDASSRSQKKCFWVGRVRQACAILVESVLGLMN